jgi:outer membrane receptor for ferrienterochelin and colicins
MKCNQAPAFAMLACAGAALSSYAAPPTPQQLDKVEVQGEALSDLQQRQEFVAGKIVVSRKAIEASGQTTVFEVLKREPAVTVGSNGRLGLLGLPGYTQILVDGKPPLPGRDPLEQDVVHIERIEIIKGSMAEFGPFGIAGTINIVTRRVERKTSASLRMGLAAGPAAADANLAWSNSIRPVDEPWSLSNRISIRHKETDVHKDTDTYDSGSPSEATLQDRSQSRGVDQLSTFSASSTYAYQWSKEVDMDVSPVLLYWQTDVDTDETHQWQNPSGRISNASASNRGTLLSAALPLSWRYRADDGGRLELQWESSRSFVDRDSDRTDKDVGGSSSTLRQSRRNERLFVDSLRAQFAPKSPEHHALKLGFRASWHQNMTALENTVNGVPDASFATFGQGQVLSGPTASAFAQDEWTLSKHWAVNAGISMEGRRLSIREGSERARARYRLVSPSLHVAHKLNDDGTRKLRFSIARSFNSPSLDQYTQRPTIHPLAPCSPTLGCGANTLAYADTAGNPGLKPERALGITLSYEHYVGKDSLVNVDVFQRRLNDTIGESVALESVPWASVPRYVIRPTNLGRARIQGASVDARLNLRDWLPSAPQWELRLGTTLASSELENLPGPDHRMAGQTPWSAKVGMRYKASSMPLELSADANWAPGLWWRSAVDHRLYQGRRQDVSMQASWTVNPAMKWRFSLSNLWSPVTQRSDVYSGSGAEARVDSRQRTEPMAGVTLELRL